MTTDSNPAFAPRLFGSSIKRREDPATGQVSILGYVAVDDCGHVIDTVIVDGQAHGGITQGPSQALCEGGEYDEQGQLLTGSLLDYTLPTAPQTPPHETAHTVTPARVNPLGVKGIGEAGAIAASAAIVNSVVDALSPLRVRHLDMPLRSERVWQAIPSAPARPTP